MFPVISKEAFADQLGVTTGVIEGWMKRDWTQGEEYVVKGRTTLINIEKVSEWLNGLLESGPTEPGSESESSSTASASTRKRSRETRPAKVCSPLRGSAANG